MTSAASLLSHQVEHWLRDAHAPGQPLAHAQVLAHDEAEAFPQAAHDILATLRLSRAYVPSELGGSLDDMPAVMHMLRSVAGHDLTLAIAHGKTFLGCIGVWTGGNDEQAHWLANRVVDGTVVSWALTERAHGSDLLSSDVRATMQADGSWRMNGEKWLINNATRGDMLCVLVRTGELGGARGFSLFLVDKQTLPAKQYEALPKIPLHGIRGADISGIRFKDAVLPATAMVGSEGKGLEIVIKSLQWTRIFCTSLSLGAMDHALRLGICFMRERQLYGRAMARLPAARHALGQAATVSLVADAVATMAARVAHGLPDELSVVSPLCKAIVPTLADMVVADVGDLLGLRGFLRDHNGLRETVGMFQKLERDNRIVAIFDGSTVVNRHALVMQLYYLSRPLDSHGERAQQAMALADCATPLRPLAFKGQQLLSPKGCAVLHALPATIERLPDNTSPALRADVTSLLAALQHLLTDMAAMHASDACKGVDTPASAFTLIKRLELCFAGACCVLLWSANVTRMQSERPSDPLWQGETWITACLAWTVARLQGLRETPLACLDMADILFGDPSEDDGPSSPPLYPSASDWTLHLHTTGAVNA